MSIWRSRIGRVGSLFRQEDGAAAIEFAIVSTALILVSLATIEFGRALQVRNELALAVDIAVREILKDADVSAAEVEETARDAFHTGQADLLDVDVGTETVDGMQFRTVSASYPFVLLIPQLANRNLTLSAAERVPLT